jgi:hypothetical protein
MKYSASNPCVWNSIFPHFIMVISDYVLLAELWYVFVCRCVKLRVDQKYSENYFDVGIIAVEISRAGPTTTVIFFL